MIVEYSAMKKNTSTFLFQYHVDNSLEDTEEKLQIILSVLSSDLRF